MRERFFGEDGAGTVSAVATIAALLLVAVVAIVGVGVYAAKTRAQAGVDAAALAGADAIVDAFTVESALDPCTVAGRVASVNGVALTSCRTRGGDIFVEGAASVSVASHSVPVRVRARAGTTASDLFAVPAESR